MTCRMILAVDQGNAIGWSDGRLPWRIPHDLKRFKDLTVGSTVVMGRSTYLSLKMPDGLPNRRNVVLTRQPWSEVRSQFGDVEIISSLDWVQAHQQCQGCSVPDVWIIGGASVYAEALRRNMVDEIYLTQVHTNSGADVILDVDLYSWKLFVIRQRALGINWELVDIQQPTVVQPTPGISFLTFRKT